MSDKNISELVNIPVEDITTKDISEVVKIPSMNHRSGSIGYVEKLVLTELLLITQPKFMIETGVFHGDTTLFLAQASTENKVGVEKLVGFDLSEVIEAMPADHPVKQFPFVEFVGGLLPAALEDYLKAAGRKIDFAVIDAGHTYDDVKAELAVIRDYLSDGAYVFCHDYRPDDPMYVGLCQAVDEFAEANDYFQLPLHPSELHGQEIIWGACVLAPKRK